MEWFQALAWRGQKKTDERHPTRNRFGGRGSKHGRKEATSRGFKRGSWTPGRGPNRPTPTCDGRRRAKRGVARLPSSRCLRSSRSPSPVRRPRWHAGSFPASTPRPQATKVRLHPRRGDVTRALWPIHGDVQRSSVRLSLGQIFNKINDTDRTAEARATRPGTYRRSEGRIRALSRRRPCDMSTKEYLVAVAPLFAGSATEVLKMFDDGRDDHLTPRIR